MAPYVVRVRDEHNHSYVVWVAQEASRGFFVTRARGGVREYGCPFWGRCILARYLHSHLGEGTRIVLRKPVEGASTKQVCVFNRPVMDDINVAVGAGMPLAFEWTTKAQMSPRLNAFASSGLIQDCRRHCADGIASLLNGWTGPAVNHMCDMNLGRECAQCFKRGSWRVCDRCESVAYCGQACQKAHWKRAHRMVCKKL